MSFEIKRDGAYWGVFLDGQWLSWHDTLERAIDKLRWLSEDALLDA